MLESAARAAHSQTHTPARRRPGPTSVCLSTTRVDAHVRTQGCAGGDGCGGRSFSWWSTSPPTDAIQHLTYARCWTSDDPAGVPARACASSGPSQNSSAATPHRWGGRERAPPLAPLHPPERAASVARRSRTQQATPGARKQNTLERALSASLPTEKLIVRLPLHIASSL